MTVPEQWQPIPGYEGYEASSLGRIRSRWIVGGSHTRGRQLGSEWHILAGWKHTVNGYRHVGLVWDEGIRTRPVHQLVAEAFHGPRPTVDGTRYEVRHLNGDKLDNRADNLRWGSQSENVLDRVRHGTHHNAIKVRCKRGHPFDDANTYIIPNSGSRACRTCRQERRARAAA